MNLRTLNGFTIVSSRQSGGNWQDVVILGARRISPDGGFEYVTAILDDADTAESWFWGHYFSGPDGLTRAVEDFNGR